MMALMMEAVRTPETSVSSNETTGRSIPEGFHLYIRSENLKLQTIRAYLKKVCVAYFIGIHHLHFYLN
jgi:hypothetical protein